MPITSVISLNWKNTLLQKRLGKKLRRIKCQNGGDFQTFQKKSRQIKLRSNHNVFFSVTWVSGCTGTSCCGLHHIEAQLWRVFQRVIAAKFSSLFSLNFAFFSSFEPLNWDLPPCKWSSVYFKGAHWLEGKFDWCYKSLTWTPRNVDGS